MSPESGAVMFMIIRIVVVLPAPLGPSSPNIDPLGTFKERLSTALNLPKAFETFVSWIAFSIGAGDYYGFPGLRFSRPYQRTRNRLGFAVPPARRGAGVVDQAGLENR